MPIAPNKQTGHHMDAQNIRPIVLAGGKGSRLWPLTSDKRPKPFLKLLSRRSMLQKTLCRLAGFGNALIVSEEKNEALLKRDLQDSALDVCVDYAALVLEPEGRSTDACIAAALHVVMREDAQKKGAQAMRAQAMRARSEGTKVTGNLNRICRQKSLKQPRGKRGGGWRVMLRLIR